MISLVLVVIWIVIWLFSSLFRVYISLTYYFGATISLHFFDNVLICFALNLSPQLVIRIEILIRYHFLAVALDISARHGRWEITIHIFSFVIVQISRLWLIVDILLRLHLHWLVSSAFWSRRNDNANVLLLHSTHLCPSTSTAFAEFDFSGILVALKLVPWGVVFHLVRLAGNVWLQILFFHF